MNDEKKPSKAAVIFGTLLMIGLASIVGALSVAAWNWALS